MLCYTSNKAHASNVRYLRNCTRTHQERENHDMCRMGRANGGNSNMENGVFHTYTHRQNGIDCIVSRGGKVVEGWESASLHSIFVRNTCTYTVYCICALYTTVHSSSRLLHSRPPDRRYRGCSGVYATTCRRQRVNTCAPQQWAPHTQTANARAQVALCFQKRRRRRVPSPYQRVAIEFRAW